MATTDFGSDVSESGNNGHGGALAPLGHPFESVPALPWQTGVIGRPEILTKKAGISELLHALRRRWALAFVLGILMGGLFFGLVFYFKSVQYEAATLLHVDQRQTSLLQSVNGLNTGEDFVSFKRNQQGMIRSHSVLNAVLRNPEINSYVEKLSDDPISWLENNLYIDFPGESGLLRIALRGERPDELVKIVNGVKDAYLSEVVFGEKERHLRTKKNMEDMYSDRQEDIRKKESDLHKQIMDFYGGEKAQKIMQDLNIRKLETLIVNVNRLEEKISDVNLRIILLQSAQENHKKAPIEEYKIEEEVGRDPQCLELNKNLQKLRGDLASAMAMAKGGVNSPRIRPIRQQIQSTEESLEERQIEVRQQATQRLMAQANSSELTKETNSLPVLDTERKALTESLEIAKKAVNEQQKEVKKIDINNLDIEGKKAELNESKVLAQRLGAELKLWDMESKAPDRIYLVEEATEPRSSDAMKKKIGMAFAALLGFCGTLAGVALVEFYSRRVNTSKQIDDGLGLRVLGQLPPLSTRASRKMAAGKRAMEFRSQLNDSVDSIRANLLHSAHIDTPRVVMVTSADPREGKTTVACQLAASLARSGRRTLLADMDLRNPTIHRVFGAAQEPGVCELLRSQDYNELIAQPSQQPNLWLLPAGRCDFESVQALSAMALGQVIEAMRSQYDVVIIDCGPVLSVADPMLLGQHVDVAILAVQRDISKLPAIYEATERLRAVGVMVLGAVVNSVKPSATSRRVAVKATATTKS